MSFCLLLAKEQSVPLLRLLCALYPSFIPLSTTAMILPRGDHTVDLEHGTFRRTLLAWITLHIVGGQFLLPILFLTFAFTRAKRHPVLVNMCAVWIFGSTIACLVFYAGKYNLSDPARTASEPLCRAQAVMMQHAVAAMLCTSAFTLIYHVRSPDTLRDLAR